VVWPNHRPKISRLKTRESDPQGHLQDWAANLRYCGAWRLGIQVPYGGMDACQCSTFNNTWKTDGFWFWRSSIESCVVLNGFPAVPGPCSRFLP
jgi:hypothetical protein